MEILFPYSILKYRASQFQNHEMIMNHKNHFKSQKFLTTEIWSYAVLILQELHTLLCNATYTLCDKSVDLDN